jgi:hypothetical protein
MPSGTHRSSFSFNIHRLPLEVRLEVFGSLTHAEWTWLARHNRRTKRVLLENQRYLAPFSRLYSLEFVRFFFK